MRGQIDWLSFVGFLLILIVSIFIMQAGLASTDIVK